MGAVDAYLCLAFVLITGPPFSLCEGYLFRLEVSCSPHLCDAATYGLVIVLIIAGVIGMVGCKDSNSARQAPSLVSHQCTHRGPCPSLSGRIWR